MHIWPESIPILIGEMGWFLLECLVFQSLYGLFLAPHHTVSRMFSMFSVLQHRSQRLGKFGTNLYTILELSWNWHVYGLMMFTNFTSSTAQGGGGSFKNRKPNRRGWLLWIRDGRAKPLMDWKVLDLSHSFYLFLWLSTYLPTYLFLCIYLSIYRSIYLSLSFI